MNLRADGVSVHLGGRTVLDAVSLEVRRGEVLALMGPNGAGKSSLLRLLAGVRASAGGTLWMDGERLSYPRADAVARRIGYLPQDTQAAWPLAVADVVALGRLPHRRAWSPMGVADHAAVAAAMQATDVSRFASRSVTTLSGGERTRVMLARVLAGSPDYVLADEPVAGLDPSHQIEVMALLARLAADGAGVVVVLHDLTLAARHANRVALLDEGRMRACGAPEEVLVDTLLGRHFAVKVDVGSTPAGRFVIPYEVSEPNADRGA